MSAPHARATETRWWPSRSAYPVYAILERVWQLRDNLSAYDASYVALAELLECSLLTADDRLGHAPGVRCTVAIVPH